METKALIKDKNGIWMETFDISSKETAKADIQKVVNYFNSTLKPHEFKRELHSLSIKNKKVIYFADPFDPPEEEVHRIIIEPLAKKGILFEKIRCTEIPPFGQKYDILFFDWGGMSMGNSLLENFCRGIIKEAENYPNRLYIMTSTFTEQAMKDALYEFKDIDLHNIFLTIDLFIEHWNKFE